MPAVKQVERIIKILQRLALNREVTVNQLYDYFGRGVPKRTIQRDLIELSAADIPLMTKKGHGRELIWYLDSNFLRFVPETIGSQELMASYFLERLAAITRGTKLEKDIESLFRKAKQLVSPEVFQSLEGMDQSHEFFGTTFTGFIDYSPHSEIIDQFLLAITDKSRCEVIYKATWKAKSSRFIIDPYMLIYHKGALYAVVYVPSYDNYIFLAIQRIKEIKLQNRKFERRPDFSLAKLREGRFGIFGCKNLKPQNVVLRFKKEVADVIAERTWHPTQKITRHRDGSLNLEIKTVISDELRGWVASWLDYVEVRQPKDLLISRDQG